MASYTAKSNSIATSYNNEMASYHQTSIAVSNANQATDDKYNQELDSYNAAINKLTIDQHKVGSWNGLGNGGYLNANVSYDITWHYDISLDSVIVTNVKAQLSSGSHYNTRFIDVLMLTRPNMSLPSPEPGFKVNLNAPGINDVAGASAEGIYNRYANDIIAYVSTTGDNRGTLYTRTNNVGAYTAKNLGNHKYEVATAFDRARGVKPQGQPDPWGDAIQGHIDYPIWITLGEIITVQLPIKPVPGDHQRKPLTPPNPDRPTPPTKETVSRQIANVSYHSNTLIQLNDENINQKLSF